MTALLSKLEALAQEVGVDVVELWDKFVAFVKAEIAHKKVVAPAPVAGSATTPVIAPSEPPAGV